MGKMHELLAVEGSISGNYNRDMGETLHVMSQAKNFTKETAVKTHFDVENSKLDITERTELKTTVPDRLKWFGSQVEKYLDVQAQKDLTNQNACADIVLDDGKVLYKSVPATTLLMLENKLGNDLRKVLESIPTLDAGVVWTFDESQNLYRTQPTKTFTTKKIMVPVILAPATDKHPAQVEKVTEDRPVAQVERTIYSGMITSGQKAALLENLDTLLSAVKKARQRANMTEVVPSAKFGETIMGFIIKNLVLGG